MKVPLSLASALLLLLPCFAWGWPTGGGEYRIGIQVEAKEARPRISNYKGNEATGRPTSFACILRSQNCPSEQFFRSRLVAPRWRALHRTCWETGDTNIEGCRHFRIAV
jgi:hypothetical protein